MGAYVSLGDVETDFGPVDAADQEKVETLIDRAEARVLQATPDLEDRLARRVTNMDLVKQVICEMVATVLRNPDGARSVTESVGPFSRGMGFGGSFTTGVDAGFGTLDLTTRHRVLLGGTKSGSVGPRLGELHTRSLAPVRIDL